MIFTKTSLPDAFVIELDKKEDTRGFFARAWDAKIFEEHGLNPKISQCNISHTKQKGTIRGMHLQKKPFEEAKLIRCTQGKIFDVIIDLRKDSPTYKQWESFELSSTNFKMLYVPEGFAHGFQSLENHTEIFYQVSQFYSPGSEIGVRWNDPTFNISWPLEVSEISEKDRSIPDFLD
ncbi:dTDP-4-dehydrorhamnose 3,5-epimerase [Nitrosopumilus sp. K4]|uniref:dTDP-4-dehydrorhamnose 3,5-epimerase n=1 Tax=Nitrosopumilus sp. K4 TaxID=2795383 RepID=UPI001BAE31FF|nr:dTDP-4-dehydrorhamnose 3,5-epimerase [Nitrosopumilus sp. K4]QUC64784.1 dTDP-4-dehydrorhamnose 3,5-epimerase [Nitrosopumilus sp. K4]